MSFVVSPTQALEVTIQLPISVSELVVPNAK